MDLKSWIIIVGGVFLVAYLFVGIVIERMMYYQRTPWDVQQNLTLSDRWLTIILWPLVLYFVWANVQEEINHVD